MPWSKTLNYDACIVPYAHFHNPTQYSHIVGLTFHFYAHIGAGPKVVPLMSKLMPSFRPFDPGIIIYSTSISM